MITMNRLVLLLTLCILFFQATGIAQQVEPYEMTLTNFKPGRPFPERGLALSCWVRTGNSDFANLLRRETTIDRVYDDTDTDLLAKHHQNIEAWKERQEAAARRGRMVMTSRNKSIVEWGNARSAWDTTGWILPLDIWALPHPEASKVFIEGKLSYVEKGEQIDSFLLTSIQFGAIDTLDFQGFQVALEPNGSGSYAGNRVQILRTQSADIFIEGIRILDYPRQQSGIPSNMIAQRGELEIPMDQYEELLDVMIYYRPLRKVELPLQLEVGLGL